MADHGVSAPETMLDVLTQRQGDVAGTPLAAPRCRSAGARRTACAAHQTASCRPSTVASSSVGPHDAEQVRRIGDSDRATGLTCSIRSCQRSRGRRLHKPRGQGPQDPRRGSEESIRGVGLRQPVACGTLWPPSRSCPCSRPSSAQPQCRAVNSRGAACPGLIYRAWARCQTSLSICAGCPAPSYPIVRSDIELFSC